jgi:hypothetical protein
MKKFIIGLTISLLMVGGLGYSYTALDHDIKANGMWQGDLYRFLDNVRLVVNEMITDHGTNKTTIDESRTAIMELIDDHDADNAGVIADLKSEFNKLRYLYLNHPNDPVNGEISTNFDVQNGDAFVCFVNGQNVLVSTDQVFDTGTSTVVTTNAYWAAGVLSSDCESATPTTYVDWGAEAVDEATAITNMASVTASGAVVLGYVAVQAAAGQDWVAGTDALETGTGGQVSQDTNYYNLSNVSDTATAAISSSPAAALTAGDPTASAGTITNSTALSLLEGQ